MIRQKKFLVLVLILLVALGAWFTFNLNQSKKIISGFPPPMAEPEWLPSALIPLQDSEIQAWIFTALDTETDFIQVFLYPKPLVEGFNLDTAIRLTSSVGDKSQPSWGPVVKEVKGCSGQTIFFLADDTSQREELKNLHFLCVDVNTLEPDPEKNQEITWSSFTPGDLISIESYALAPFAEVELIFTTVEGKLYSSTSAGDRLWDQGRFFSEYKNPIYGEDDRHLYFLGMAKDGAWQIGVIDMMSDEEIQLSSFENLPLFSLQKIPNFKDALVLMTGESLLVIQTSLGDAQKLVWNESAQIFPLPKNFSGKLPRLWGGMERLGAYLEILPELISQSGDTHEIAYAKAVMAQPVWVAEPISQIQTAAWVEQSSLSCMVDSRNPILIFSGDTAPQLFSFILDKDKETVSGSPVNIPDVKDKPCECTQNEACDDGSPCTEDLCVNNVCQYTKTDPTCCNLAEECDGLACVDHVCTKSEPEGEPKKENSCNNDADCSGANGGDLCVGVYYCDKSADQPEDWKCALNPSTVVECSMGADTECKQNTCNPVTGKCALVATNEGKACKGDFDSCYKNNVCTGGICMMGKWDYADPKCQCHNESDCAVKEDGDLCNGTLYCNLATHQCLLNPATKVSCPSVDDTYCIKNLCGAKTGKCAMTPVNGGKLCDDGDKCSSGEACLDGKCQGGKNVCECKSSADCAGKNKEDLCQGVFYCDYYQGKCVWNESTKVICQTVNDTSCSQNICDPKSGKCGMKSAQDGTPCDADSQACTKNDQCLAGQCKAGAWDFTACECGVDADCAKLEDGNLCNGTLYCDKKNNKCLVNPKTIITCVSNTVCNPKIGQCAVAP